MGLVDSKLCTRCEEKDETIEHALWDCEEVQKLLESFEMILDALIIPFAFNKITFIFGLYDKSFANYKKSDNVIILIVKQYIYSTRCLGKALSIYSLLVCIHEHYKTLKYINDTKNDSIRLAFADDWNKWLKLFSLIE